MQSQMSHRLARHPSVGIHRAARRCRAVASVQNGSSNGAHTQACPTPAETARTIIDIVNEGSLCSVCADGSPLGAPVAYQLDKDGQPVIQVAAASLEAANLQRDARVSLLVQPTAFPARGVASVALQGKVQPHELEEGSGSGEAAAFKLHVDQCVYYGGLDNVRREGAVLGQDKGTRACGSRLDLGPGTAPRAFRSAGQFSGRHGSPTMPSTGWRARLGRASACAALRSRCS